MSLFQRTASAANETAALTRKRIAERTKTAPPEDMRIDQIFGSRFVQFAVSADDGKTWRALQVPPNGVAPVTYPKGKGFVSVRLHAAGDNGSSVTQTVIRAYRFS